MRKESSNKSASDCYMKFDSKNDSAYLQCRKMLLNLKKIRNAYEIDKVSVIFKTMLKKAVGNKLKIFQNNLQDLNILN